MPGKQGPTGTVWWNFRVKIDGATNLAETGLFDGKMHATRTYTGLYRWPARTEQYEIDVDVITDAIAFE